MKKSIKALATLTLSLSLILSNSVFAGAETALEEQTKEHENSISSGVVDYNASIQNGTTTPDFSDPSAYINAVTGGTNSAGSTSTSSNANTTTNPSTSTNNSESSTNSTDVKNDASNKLTTEDTTVKFEEATQTLVNSFTFSNSNIIVTPDNKTTTNVYLKNLKIEVPITDSEFNTYYAYIKDGDKVTDDTVWKSASTTVTITQEGKGKVYFKVSDGENEYLANTNSFVLDKTKPVVKGIVSGKTYSTARNITINDTISGIKSVTVNGKKVNVTKELSLSKAGNYTISVTDNSNNVATLKFKIK